MNYLLSKVKVKDVMTKNVLTVTEDTPLEDAARIMADNQIGGLPVMRGDHMVGIITETDLFKIFLELLGARDMGVRVTVLIPNQPGQLAKITQAIASAGGDFVAFVTFSGQDPSNSIVTFKVACLEKDQAQAIIEPIVDKLIDIR